jgi:sugar fermentation stimulation protein A
MSHSILTVSTDAEGVFKSRPNKFLGTVELVIGSTGRRSIEMVHIHDPGRLKELLYSGNRVLVRRAKPSSTRKTKWDLIAAQHNDHNDNSDGWVLVHSGFHRAIVESILKNQNISPFGELKDIRPEITVGHSRLDFQLTKTDNEIIFVEVKGCTLIVDGVALFPDAPTTRGTRHLETLMDIKRSGQRQGQRAAVIVLVFRANSRCFAPNRETDPKFAQTFYKAKESGVEVYPIVMRFQDHTIDFVKHISVLPNRL